MSARSDQPRVAFVRNPQQDLLATNTLGRAFYSPLIGDGGLSLAYEELAITAEPGHILMIYTAEPGSSSAERLASLAATPDATDHAMSQP